MPASASPMGSPIRTPAVQDPMHVESPYAPPRVPNVEDARGPSPVALAKKIRWAFRLAVLPLFFVALLVVANTLQPHARMIADGLMFIGAAGLLVSLVTSAIGGVLGFRGLREGNRMMPPLKGSLYGMAFGATILGGLSGMISAAYAALIVLMAIGGFSRGRQVRRRGRPQFAALTVDEAWLGDRATSTSKAPDDRAAEAWRQNGLTEHASVAAFAALSLELAELGAPPALQKAASEDALDEIRHTELCFGLAQHFDGRPLSPAAFPAGLAYQRSALPRSFRLAKLAVTSLLDGAIHEGLSARALAELLDLELDPKVRPVIEGIVADEARHAAHGFQVVRWCLSEGGATVAIALHTAIQHLPDHLDLSDHPAIAEQLGIPTKTRLERVYAEVKAKTVRRTARLLAAS